MKQYCKEALVTLFIVLLFSLVSSPSWGGSLQDLEKEFTEFKRTTEAQSKNIATAVNQMQEISAEFQGMSGRIDQSLHENAEQAKVMEDAQKRLAVLEDKISLLVKQLEEIKTAGLLPPGETKNLKEFQDFEKALSLVNADDYRGAIGSLKQFLSTNPKSVLAESAQYWIGESYYAMRDFAAAVSEFQKVIQKYPGGAKVASALLKQGYSFYEMQSFDEAKAFLVKLVGKYPDAVEAIKARERIKKIEALLEEKARQAP